MGQRHQLFVIARINGKYRTLAAVHHQWLYGHTALRRCLGTLKIFQDAKNRPALEEELKLASKREEHLWKTPEARKQWPDVVEVHFPFTVTCLVLGASFGMQDGYFHNVDIESFHMAYDEGDNNNGITIFDISEPSNVRYCFVDFMGMESDRPVQLMTPLSARIYLEAYYDLGNPEFVELVSLVEQFKGWNLIDVNALEDTWPGQDWQAPQDQAEEDGRVEPVNSKLPVSDDGGPTTSLRSRTLDQLVQSVVNGEETDPQVLSDAEMLTDFYTRVRGKLYEQAGNLESSPTLLEVLFNSLKGETYVNLGLFSSLSTTEISSLAIRLTLEGCVEDLNLSGLDIPDTDLRTILDHERIQRVYLMGENAVSLDILMALKPTVDLCHYELLKRPLLGSRLRDNYGIGTQPSLPLLDFSASDNRVVQLVWVPISGFVFRNPSCFQPNGSIDWSKLGPITGAPRQMFSISEEEPRYRQYPLIDVPMSLTRLVTGLSSMLQWTSRSDAGSTWEFSKGISGCFALGQTPSDTLSCGIGPFSTELSLNNGTNAVQSEGLKPGQWAIVLINTFFDARCQEWIDSVMEPEIAKGRSFGFPLKKQVKYAIITPATNSTDPFVVADVPKFLSMASNKPLGNQLSEGWKEQEKGTDEVRFYEGADIQQILAKIYEPREEAEGSSD